MTDNPDSSSAWSPVCIKMRRADHNRLRREAREAGMTLSSWGRFKMLGEPETAVRYRLSQTRRLIKDLIGQIGRVGNNMNQIAWKLNSEITLNGLDRQLHAEGVEALKQMRGVLVNHLLKPNGPC